MPNLILASKSPQRNNLLKTLNVPFTSVPAEIDEQAITAPTQKFRAEKVARAKAEAVAKDHPDSVILAGDTFVLFGTRALEKPQTKEEAREMLMLQSGRTLTEYTGVCYLDPINKINESKTVEVKVVFRDLSESEINHYVKTQPVTTWSAGFSPAYDEGVALIASIEGSLTGFTHGFPMEFFVPLLKKSGFNL